MDLSIIIVNWNTHDLLAQCLHSVFKTVQHITFEVFVVDNASTDGSVEMVRQTFPSVHLITNSENEGFARANNQAMAFSRGRYILLFNSDAIATDEAIQSLVDFADSQPKAGVVGAQLLNLDGSFQASYTPFPTFGQEFLILTGLGRLVRGPWYPSRGPNVHKGPQIVDYVEGACLLARREAVSQVGGLDERYFMYAEEVDWCYSIKHAGWQIWYQPTAKIVHVGSGSSQERQPQREVDLYRSRVQFFRKHYGGQAATLLKIQIWVLTSLKIVAYRFLGTASGGRYCRPIVRLGHLTAALKSI